MPETWKAAIIGCGNIAFGHARVLSALDDACVVGIADPTPQRRQKMQEFLKLPAEACFEDYHDLLALKPDYVIVATPQHIRRQIVLDCAAAGVNVLSEKPLATIPADAQAMIAAMRGAGLRYGMMHNYLYYPEYVLARRLVAEGAIGRLRHVALNFLGVPDHPGAAEYQPRWRHDPVAAGGGILMDMIHAVYLAEFLLSEPIQGVTAVVDNLDHPGEQVEDFTIVNYHFPSGYATVNMWWGNGPGGLALSGTTGRILVFYENYGTGPFTQLQSFLLVNEQGEQSFDPRSGAGGPEANPFVQIHRDFLGALRDKRDPLAPGEAGLRALEATLAAYASGATGSYMPLPLAESGALFQQGAGGLRALAARQDGHLYQQGVFGLGR